MFPYLDLAGFKRRTMMPQSEVDYVNQDSPGFIEQRIASRSSLINARLRKRYGNTGARSSLPLGQQAPTLVAAGTSPPSVTLSGRPTLGSLQIGLSITLGGVTGVATFSWTADGVTYTTAMTASSVVLGSTGLTALFPATGTFAIDNVYAAATPVPETVLGWLVTMVTYDCYRKRGVNPQDPQIQLLVEEYNTALAELKEAADSKDGLFDLPTSEDQDSAVTTGGPLGCSQASPYVWQDVERARATAEDTAFSAQDAIDNPRFE